MKISIYDTTLRDGAQAEGISFSIEDKIKIVKALDKFGVDYIEAGNPFSNPKDAEFFRVVKDVKLTHSKLVAFGSTRYKNKLPQEDLGILSLLNTPVDTVAIFGKSHDFHVTEILNTTLEENLEMISSSIEYLTKNGKSVVFDGEHFFDGYKSNREYALKTLVYAQNAGADFLVLCDTNGGCFPFEIEEIVNDVKKHVSIPIGIHTHDDTGCAVASSISAVKCGATMVQGTFTGFGERCGNANLSSIIPGLQIKLGYDCVPSEKLSKLTQTAHYISEIANISLKPTFPYVGKSAFAHKGGMHVDGITKNSKTFEHIKPDEVGNERSFLLSEVSGKKTIISKIKNLIPDIEERKEQLGSIVDLLKEREFQGYVYEAAGASFELLVLKHLGIFNDFFKIVHYKTISDEHSVYEKEASAIIKIAVGEETTVTAAEGDGPVNALDKALREALSKFYPDTISKIKLTDYKVRVINTGEGTESCVRVSIETSDDTNSWVTVGASTDVIAASLKALVDSIEYKLFKQSL